VTGLNVINYIASHDMNPVVLTAGLHLKILSIPWITALAALASTDGYSLLCFIFLHPVHGLLKQTWPILLLGLPGGILFLTLLYRQCRAQGPAQLAILNLATSMILYLGIWNLSMVFDYDGRYLAVFSMGALPVALEEGFRLWRRTPGRFWKTTLGSAGLLYVLVPLLYGVVSVASKVHRIPSDYACGPSHIYNDLLAAHDLAGVRRELLKDYQPATDIWYLPDNITSLDIPGRAIICSPDFGTIPYLLSFRYQSPVTKRIRMLLPPSFESNGKGPVIRRTFPQAQKWTCRDIPGCHYLLWETTLKPHD
jgi:hypothetical protein